MQRSSNILPARRVVRRTPALLAWSVMLTGLCAARLAFAQAPDATSLNHLVLSWIQGNYATPLVCKIDGAAKRGLRRIVVEPPDLRKPTPETIIRFIDLEAQDATRCFTEIGGESPNITGELVVRHAITKIRDTANRDFKLELKRKRGFDLDIVSGNLVFAKVGSGAQAPKRVDFRGGSFRIHILRRGTDALRLLQDLPSPRQVMLEFETRAGERHAFPASLSKPPEASPRSSAARGHSSPAGY